MPRDLPRARPPPGTFPRPPRALPPGLSPPRGTIPLALVWPRPLPRYCVIRAPAREGRGARQRHPCALVLVAWLWGTVDSLPGCIPYPSGPYRARQCASLYLNSCMHMHATQVGGRRA
jgi:hypothetical protein